MHKGTLYLLAGNGGAADWWEDALPHFHAYTPQPIELPGFGDNPAPPLDDIGAYAEALLAATQVGNSIFAVGVNALLVLHALQRRPKHFSRVILLAPVGAFLWQRRLPWLMALPPLRRFAYWLLTDRPHWLAHKFSRQRWSHEQYRRMGRGYQRCRAFLPYWDIVRADTALPLLEWLDSPIELVWGDQDAVLGSAQAAAWSAILARAELSIHIRPGWGHYPWIDDPVGFVAWLESNPSGFHAHGKAGRLRLAALAGQPVPPSLTVTATRDPALQVMLDTHSTGEWAVRSSSRQEDQADKANAGLSTTFLLVPGSAVPAKVQALLDQGIDEVLVQPFIDTRVSGIAFVRHLAAEIEWVEGHLAALADGQCTPQRVVISRLGGDWSEGVFPASHGLSAKRLWQFLQDVLRCFHYVHGDIEWAWDGRQLWLLQYRPISDYGWRRHLTAANIGEILPAQPSRLVEYAQHRAASSIPAIMARWDSRMLNDAEPFTARFDNASYINNDLFLARLADWGMAAQRYAQEVGGATPALPWRPWRWIGALPILLRLLLQSRAGLLTLEATLRAFDKELTQLQAQQADGQALADWYCRFHLFTVQGNLCIANALASSGGSAWGRPKTVYATISDMPHRLPWETDPASPRQHGATLDIQPFPDWPQHIRLAHRYGLPGLRGHYLQVREWYRDNLMRVFYRLHHAMPISDRSHWFAPHASPRTRTGSFWQDGSRDDYACAGFVIHPGEAEGILGRDILLEAALDPGRHAQYQSARGVIALMGGRLSHGATLLRELRKPSAVLPDVDASWLGQLVRLKDGKLTRLQATSPETAATTGSDTAVPARSV